MPRPFPLESFFSSSPAGMAILDGRLRYILVNETLAAMNGVAADEHPGRSVAEVLPRLAPVLEPLLREVLETGRTLRDVRLSGETPLQDGARRAWQISLFPLRGEDRVEAVGAVVVETTGLEDALRQKAAGDELFRQLTDGIREVFFVSAPDLSKMHYVSPAYEKTWGRTRESLYAEPRSFLDGVHPDDKERLLRVVAAEPERPASYGYRIVRDDGEIRWIDVRRFPVLREDGSVEKFVGFAEDVTERTLAEQRAAKAEAQFLQAQKMEAVGRLAGGVAHDFNNILTAILGYCTLLKGSLEVGDPRGDDLQEISAAASRASALTRQLLAFSRRQVLAPAVVDVNALLGDMEKMLVRLIGEDVALRFSLDPSAPRVVADPGQLEQVVMNLVVNARDAMARAGSIIVSTRRLRLAEALEGRHDIVPAGEYCALSVSDDGQGMEPETLEHLFEPFFTTKPSGKGTGLGLSTVYGIVKQSGGAVQVSSLPGKGSIFTVYLPETTRPAGAAREEAAPRLASGSGRVLVVDDEDPVRALLGRVLRGCGYEVVEASDGDDALRLVDGAADGLDLLLTDLVMPRLGGVELAARLRASNPGLRVIYMSGYPDRADPGQLASEPGVVFLPKPVFLQELLAKVREALQ